MNLHALLARAYPSPEWATFFEVSNATGSGSRRRADAVAFGIWPSRGLAIYGFEIKHDRHDWIREKRNPAKADVIAAHVDRFFLVTPNERVAQLEEIPEAWGWLVASPSGDRLLAKKPAALLNDSADKTMLRRSFAAAVLRKVGETTTPNAVVASQIEAAVQDRVARTIDGRTIENLRSRVEHLEGVIRTFEERSGVNIASWRGPAALGKAVEMLLDGDYARRTLATSAATLRRAADDIDAGLKAWPALKEGA